jgi:4-hydroxy-tetrahydrodipicolinate synthase
MPQLDKLTGVLVALASPLQENGSPDEAAIDRLVEHVLSGGVSGLLPLGSTGEASSLDESARRKVLARVVKAAALRVPVICGVAQTTISAARTEVEAAASLGADAALVVPPFYYPADQNTVLEFYRRVADASPLPILLYNIPQFTKVVAEPATVATLAREGTIAGIKDSSRDFEYFEGVLMASRELAKFRVFTGSDTMLLASLVAGGSGAICGAGNVAPRWVVQIYDDFGRQDIDAARAAQDKLYKLVVALRAGTFPGAIKAALHMQGVCEPWLAPPVRKLDEHLTARLREQLDAWGLLAPIGSRER